MRRRAGYNAIAMVCCAVLIFPVYWMVATAFKQPGRVMESRPRFFPWPISLGNFRHALSTADFGGYATNSVLIALSTVVISMVVGLSASIALSRFRFPGRRAFQVLLVLVQMVPGAAILIPMYLMFRSLGLLDLPPVLVLTHLTFVLPFTIWTMRAFVDAVPPDLEQAAMVDGCGRLGAYVRILLPLLAPGAVSTAIFAFIHAWDDYLFAYVLMTSQQHYTLPVWLVSFQTQEGVDYGAMIAASTVFSLPVLVFFLLVQRKLVAGMTGGAVKG